jgi:hypothetical protein
MKRSISILKYIASCSILLQMFVIEAAIYKYQPEEKLSLKISKSGLNRISNPPHKITQLTGDESKFRIKYDEDGSNIYFMPLSNIGETIEVSIKNNVGDIQDLELSVANIKGRSIVIDGKTGLNLDKMQKTDVAQMLRAMKENIESKFYVQNTNQKLGSINNLQVKQTKIYRYKGLAGGVFEIKNNTKQEIVLNNIEFAKRFDRVKSFYPQISTIYPKQTATLLVVQEREDR